MHQKGLSATTKYKNGDKWNNRDKFTIVFETVKLSEIEFSEYCCEKGIYSEQVKEWKEACINANEEVKEKIQGQAENIVKKEKEKSISGSNSTLQACVELGISKRTYNRWRNTDSRYIDNLTVCKRPELANKMVRKEKEP